MSTVERRADERAGYPPPALTVAVLALLAVVLAVVAVGAIVDTSARVTAAYTAVEVDVVDDRLDDRTTVGRSGSITAPYRVVTVELRLPRGRTDNLALVDPQGRVVATGLWASPTVRRLTYVTCGQRRFTVRVAGGSRRSDPTHAGRALR